MRLVLFLSLCAAAACGVSPRSAHACGASGGGIAGTDACSLEEHSEEARPKFRLGAAATYTSTVLRFSADRRAEQQRALALPTFDWRPKRNVTLRIGVGGFLGGAMTMGGVRYVFDPGLVATSSVSWRPLDAEGMRPFLILSAEVATNFTSTRPSGGTGSAAYRAFDLRVGAAAGYPIAGIVAPYVLARAFGGPVYWAIANESVTGTDVHHFQIGGGISFTPVRRFDLFLEGVPLGERSASAGAGWSF